MPAVDAAPILIAEKNLYFIMNSWSMVDYKGIFVEILALSIMSFIIFKVIDILEKKICLMKKVILGRMLLF